jgi:hypothetical protein
MIASVGSTVADGSAGTGLGDGSTATGVAVGRGMAVHVGQGVGVGSEGPGMATMIKLAIMLMASKALMATKMIWLVLRFWRPFLRLLTREPPYTTRVLGSDYTIALVPGLAAVVGKQQLTGPPSGGIMPATVTPWAERNHSMKCSECGTRASEDDLFCGECGAVLPTFDPDAVVSAGAAPDRGVPADTAPDSAAKGRDPRAQASFVLGIVALGLSSISWCLPVVSIFGCLSPVAALVAIILGAVAKRDIARQGGLETDRRKAQQGLILGVVSLVVLVIVGVLILVLGVRASILNEF